MGFEAAIMGEVEEWIRAFRPAEKCTSTRCHVVSLAHWGNKDLSSHP